MKYARDRKITSTHTAEVLIEAFPWIKNATGKTILIKYGGAAMVDPKLRNAVMSDIVMLKIMGVNGTDAGTIIAEQASPDLGRVGKVVEVNPSYINALIAADYVPIIASVGKGTDDGSFNINADVAACAVASAIGAHKIIFLTDVDGYYEDFSDKGSLISQMTVSETKQMLAEGKVSSGMIPKLQSCIEAIEGGVPRAHIVNGTKPHSILVELLTSSGAGTLIYDDDAEFSKDEMRPLGILASRLSENL